MGETTRSSRRMGAIAKSAIHEMTRLAGEIEDVAFLSWAKPTSAAPRHVQQAAVAAIEAGRCDGYSVSAGLPELRAAIATKLGQHNQIVADPAEIIVTVGAIEGLSAALLAVVDPGDEVILPSPTYSTHANQVMLASATPVFVPTDEERGFAWDPDAVRAAITPRTRAILYCSPSNPTGAVLDEPTLRAITSIALEHDLVVITDEAYEYFVFDGHRHCSIASFPEMRDHAISCFTFTKTYAMTGWRIGYLHASKAWIGAIGKAHIPLAICTPVASQYAALAALQGEQGCVEQFRRHYESARDLMCARLDRLSSVFSYQKPAGSYLMFPKISAPQGRDSQQFCRTLLRQAHVSTTPGQDFGPTGEGHLRLSFCVPEPMIERAFDRLDEHFHV